MIRARGLGRSFGDRDVVRGLALDVPAGGFMLVTGSNGSGKSTLLMLMAGLLAPTAGTLEVGVSRARVGYLGHDPLVYRELTALENLDLYAQLYRVPDRTARIRQLLTQYGLSGVERERVGRFSRGMSQRLALCRVMLHDPELVLLDEPHASLDDDGAALLDEELARVAGAKTIVVSSHDPARLEPLATLRLRL